MKDLWSTLSIQAPKLSGFINKRSENSEEKFRLLIQLASQGLDSRTLTRSRSNLMPSCRNKPSPPSRPISATWEKPANTQLKQNPPTTCKRSPIQIADRLIRLYSWTTIFALFYYIYSMSLNDVIFMQLTNRCRESDLVEMNYSSKIDANGLFLKSSAKPVAAGDIIFEEYPVGGSAVAYFHHCENYCSNCVKPLPTDRIDCANGCHEKYCSEECRKWAKELYHSTLCCATNEAYRQYFDFAKSTSNEYYLESSRLLCMLPNAPWLFHYHCPPWDELEGEIDAMSRCLRLAIRNISISPDVLKRTIGMLRVNVLGMKFNDTEVGFAMYPKQALMNHSSDANCRCVTHSGNEKPDNPCLCGIEALRNIAPGEELTIDYLGDSQEGQERLDTLRYQYGIVEDSPRDK